MFFNAGGNGKNIRIKNNVFRRKSHLVNQHAVSAFANFYFALVGVGLTLFIESHDHGGSAIAIDQLCLAFEFIQAFFHADGIHNALALYATQARFDHRPLGAVDHDGHAGNIGLGRNQIQKSHHGRLAVEHGFVHVDVDDLRPVFYLLTRHRQSLLILAIQNHAGKGFGAGDIGALADVDECGLRLCA